MPSTFLAPSRSAREVAADLRRRATMNEARGNVWRAKHLRNLADRLLAALNLPE